MLSRFAVVLAVVVLAACGSPGLTGPDAAPAVAPSADQAASPAVLTASGNSFTTVPPGPVCTPERPCHCYFWSPGPPPEWVIAEGCINPTPAPDRRR